MRVLGYLDLKQKGIRFSRQWIARLVSRGKFPAPIRLGEQSVAFVEAEIDEWLAARIRERDEQPISNVRIISEIAPLPGFAFTKPEQLKRPAPISIHQKRRKAHVGGERASEDA